MLIWPLFGTTNQLLAALTLVILTVMLVRRRRSSWMLVGPLVFLLTMAIFGLLVQLGQLYESRNWPLLILDVIILIAALWVTLESILVLRGGSSHPEALDDEVAEGAATQPVREENSP